MSTINGFNPADNLPGAGPGRPKGASNKLTRDLREALMAPFDLERFKAWAKKKEDAYFTLIITKLLPKDIHLRTITSLDDLRDEEKEQLLDDLRKRLEDKSDKP
jgi:hypothetical protein